MDKATLEKFLEKLKELDTQLSDDENVDLNVFNEIDKTVNSINLEIREEKTNNNDLSLNVNVKRLSSLAVIPTYAKFGDAGLDLTMTRIINETEDKITYGTDLCFEIPLGYVGLIFPRSSIRKYELDLSNCVGVIDSGYRGEVQATFNKLNGNFSIKYEVGERMGQMIILPIPKINLNEVTELSETERGTGGFGSSNK